MADEELSGLATGASVGDTDIFYSGQAGSPVKQPGSALAAYILNKSPWSMVYARVPAVNLNALGDTVVLVPLPAGITTFSVNLMQALRGSLLTPITTAKVGLYTGPGQTGIAIVNQTTMALTSNSPGVAGGMQQFTINNPATAFYNVATLYLNVGTIQGAAALADFAIAVRLGAS